MIKIPNEALPHVINIIAPDRISLRPVLTRARVAWTRILRAALAKYENGLREKVLDYVPSENGEPIWPDPENPGVFGADNIEDEETRSDFIRDVEDHQNTYYTLVEDDNPRLFARIKELIECIMNDEDYRFTVHQYTQGNARVVNNVEERVFDALCESFGLEY